MKNLMQFHTIRRVLFATFLTLASFIIVATQEISKFDDRRTAQDPVAAKGAPAACPTPPQPVGDTKCYSGSGCLDVSFDMDGLVTTYLNNFQGNILNKMLVQPDGKIIAIGQSVNGATGTAIDFIVARYNADGSVDTSFGDFDPFTLQRRGLTLTSFTASQDRGETGALQADGKIIAAGYGNGSWALARYNPDGSLDTGFDGDGKITFDLGSSSIRGVVVQADGKIVLAGGEPNYTLVRLNPNGSTDSSFGTNGKVTVNPSTNKNGNGYLWSLAIQRVPATDSEERFVVAGWAATGGGSTTMFVVLRFRSTGALDTSFGSGGRALTSFYGQGDQARQVTVDSSNRIVAGGLVRSTACTGNLDFGVARYTQNGVLDTSFSGDGKVSTDVYSGDNSPYALVVQADGKPIIAGSSGYPDYSVRDFTLIRYNANGTPDNTFGPGFLGAGVVTTRFPGSNSNWNYSLALQPNGNIISGGVANLGRLAIARYLP